MVDGETGSDVLTLCFFPFFILFLEGGSRWPNYVALAFDEHIYSLERLLAGAVPVTPYCESKYQFEGLRYSIPKSAYLTLQRDKGTIYPLDAGTRPERHTTHTVSGHWSHGTFTASA